MKRKFAIKDRAGKRGEATRVFLRGERDGTDEKKGSKRTKSGPKMKYETGPFSYASRAWYTSNVGGKKPVKK